MYKYLKIENITTIITTILLTVFGALLGYLSSMGLNLPVTADALATITGGIILAVFSWYNAKHHNTLFNDETDTIYIPIDNLTDGQIESINNFINNAIETNLKHSKTDYSEDPAITYEEEDNNEKTN